MKKIAAAGMMILIFTVGLRAFAAEDLFDFTGTWSGDYCTMSAGEGLDCGRLMAVVVAEQKNNLIRGTIKIGGKDYLWSGTISPGHRIDYTDSLGTVGVLSLTRERNLQMKALNRCLSGRDQCAHSGILMKKK
ncbi:MAG: hypothetical protein EG826_05565 [Deltaproteobacteria bacterium]|nr:hypothetical protein [Deltaproteobacteria bacterium]